MKGEARQQTSYIHTYPRSSTVRSKPGFNGEVAEAAEEEGELPANPPATAAPVLDGEVLLVGEEWKGAALPISPFKVSSPILKMINC